MFYRCPLTAKTSRIFPHFQVELVGVEVRTRKNLDPVQIPDPQVPDHYKLPKGLVTLATFCGIKGDLSIVNNVVKSEAQFTFLTFIPSTH